MRIALTILAILLAGAGPASRPADRKEELRKEIIHRVFELDSTDPTIRSKATTRLMEIGPMALDILKEVAEGGGSPELKARAKGLISDIPASWKYISTEGGAVAAGFQATLRIRQEQFTAGEAVKLTLQLQNVGGTKRRMVNLRGLDVEVDGKMATSKWSDGRVIVRTISAAKPPEPRAIVMSRGEMEMADVDIGGTLGDAIDLSDALKLPPGEYEVRVVYYTLSHDIVPGAEDDVRSNAAKIKVVAP